MKALTMVAHPDDCVIFAWSFMHHYNHLEWTICYLTYHEHDLRAQEIARFWQPLGIPLIFLGHTDDYRDLETGRYTFAADLAEKDIKRELPNHELVLTHDRNGDYGHLHHKFVHDVVSRFHSHVITFASPQSGNAEYVVENPDYSALDIHRDIVQSFHTQAHKNRYDVPPHVQQLIKESRA